MPRLCCVLCCVAVCVLCPRPRGLARMRREELCWDAFREECVVSEVHLFPNKAQRRASVDELGPPIASLNTNRADGARPSCKGMARAAFGRVLCALVCAVAATDVMRPTPRIVGGTAVSSSSTSSLRDLWFCCQSNSGFCGGQLNCKRLGALGGALLHEPSLEYDQRWRSPAFRLERLHIDEHTSYAAAIIPAAEVVHCHSGYNNDAAAGNGICLVRLHGAPSAAGTFRKPASMTATPGRRIRPPRSLVAAGRWLGGARPAHTRSTSPPRRSTRR